MEEVYQAYKDDVNFLWVYGLEAHPEEHPFQAGYETADLGWNHPYAITEEMAERAQRAKWLKTDPTPDLEMPMIIDYINDPPNVDNAIKTAYMGGGFYSGYIIDCDGNILVREPWAWAGPEGQWWGLPLADVDNLTTYLDDYLDNPPECYVAGDADVDTDTEEDPVDDSDDSSGGASSGCSGTGKKAASKNLLSVISALFA